ncbi:GSCOCG00004015001-RA-CDS [Cotesia congregata]|nr:GSCOCG00004015001-RA-CDS [Cotesia congregata]
MKWQIELQRHVVLRFIVRLSRTFSKLGKQKKRSTYSSSMTAVK